MKNFLRALRHALPYRRRLILSVLAALFAAIFWGLNFTSIYPVLKLLHTEQSPHDWINEQIKVLDKEITSLEEKIATARQLEHDLEGQPGKQGPRTEETRHRQHPGPP